MLVNDAELIARVLASDDHYAFTQLVSKYQSQVRLFLRRMLKSNTEIADELAQETFILAYKKLKTFEGKSSFASWLYAIAKNLFLQHFRKTKKDFSWEEDQVEDIDTSDTSLRIDLEEGIKTLRPIERAVITMCYCQELSHADVSHILEIPLGTVKTHVKRGREKLKAYLEEYNAGVANG